MSIHEVFVVLGALAATGVYVWEARRRGMADRRYLLVAAGALVAGALVAKGATAWRYLLTTDEPSLYGVLAYGGKSILGGLFGAYFGAELVKRLVGIRHSTGDLFAPAVPAGMAVGRIGCFLTEPLGTPTSLPWAVTGGDGVARHPSHLYEVVFQLLSLWLVLRYRDRVSKQGATFYFWLLGYGIFRFGNEFLRENPPLLWGLSGSQVFLLFTVPLLAWGLLRQWRQGLFRPPVLQGVPS